MKSILLAILILSGQCAFAQEPVFVFYITKPTRQSCRKNKSTKLWTAIWRIFKKCKDGLLVAGPFEGGGGIFIFNSHSVDEVTQWLNDDPGVKAPRWNVEAQPYRWHADQPRLVQEHFEMTNYQFVSICV
jgi:hypothetical protein